MYISIVSYFEHFKIRAAHFHGRLLEFKVIKDTSSNRQLYEDKRSHKPISTQMLRDESLSEVKVVDMFDDISFTLVKV